PGEQLGTCRELGALTFVVLVTKRQRVDETRPVEMHAPPDDCQCLVLGIVCPDEVAALDVDQFVEHGRSVLYRGSVSMAVDATHRCSRWRPDSSRRRRRAGEPDRR